MIIITFDESDAVCGECGIIFWKGESTVSPIINTGYQADGNNKFDANRKHLVTTALDEMDQGPKTAMSEMVHR